MKLLRSAAAITLIILGIIFTILPGSILLVLGGLVLLSVDFPQAKKFLSKTQRATSRTARKVDLFLLKRKHR
jgi:hypothetical protein